MKSDKNDTTEISNTPTEIKSLGILSLYGGQSLWFPVLALTCFGLLFVYSASSVYAGQKYGDEYIFVKKQFIFLFPAIVCGFLGAKVKISFLAKYAGKIFVAMLILTLLTKAPLIGKKVKGAARWVALGGLQIQPSEFLKLATILFTSTILSKYPKKFTHLWPIPFALMALLMQPDFGSTLILLCGLSAIILVHGLPLRFFFGIALLFLPVLIGIMVAAPYRMRRLITFLDPFADPLGSGFQVIQSFVAIVNGGWFGRGLGSSQQKLFFLPEAHTDFILAVIAEEMGFVGIAVILSIYILFFFAILQLLRQTKSHQSRLIGTGIFAIFSSSALVNMGVVAGLLPTKGLPLPFVSAGGSSLLANFFMVGILSQIYRNNIIDSETSKTSPLSTNSELNYLPNLRTP